MQHTSLLLVAAAMVCARAGAFAQLDTVSVVGTVLDSGTRQEQPDLVGFPFPPISFAAVANYTALPKDWTTAYTEQCNFNVQQPLGRDSVLQVGYIGNRSGLPVNVTCGCDSMRISAPAPHTWGNVGRNILRGPAAFNFGRSTGTLSTPAGFGTNRQIQFALRYQC